MKIFIVNKFKSIMFYYTVMTKPEQTSDKQSKDNLTIFEKSSRQYFVNIESSVPHFQQVLFDLQNEYYKAWKNAINTNIFLHREFVNKTGLNFVLPEFAQKMFESMNDELVMARTVRDKISIATLDAVKRNIKMWNDNASIFANLDKNVMQFWISAFTPKPKS